MSRSGAAVPPAHSDPQARAAPPPPEREWRSWIPLPVLILIGLVTHWEMLSYELVGYDSFPLIRTSRILSVSDFFDTFTESMMEGRYPGGDFYRPTQQFFLAVEYAVWGVRPFGYHLTSLSMYVVCIMLFCALVRRLLGPRAWIATSIATLMFVLHPSMLSVLPVVARRVELLVLLFTLLALLMLPTGDRRLTARRLVAMAFLVLLACGSKEVGCFSIGLVFLHQLLFNGGDRIAPRIKRAVISSGVALLAFALFFANRSWVIYHATDGETWLGGHPREEGVSLAALIGDTARVFAEYTFCWCRFYSGPLSETDPASIGLVAGLVTVIVALIAMVGAWASRDPAGRRAAGIIVIGLAWIGANVVINSFAGKFNPRYVMLVSAGLGLVWAGLVECMRLMLARSAVWKGLSAIPAGAIAVGAVAALHVSPLWTDYLDWRGASQIQRAFLADSLEKLESARPGSRVREQDFPHMPLIEDSDNLFADRPHIDNVVMLAPWSMQAWAELVIPNKRITVFKQPDPRRLPAPAPDEIQYHFGWSRRGPGQYRNIKPFGDLSHMRTRQTGRDG